ncbi:hypothetical protein PMIN03_007899 [Paraphaeosphaeria minitans]
MVHRGVQWSIVGAPGIASWRTCKRLPNATDGHLQSPGSVMVPPFICHQLQCVPGWTAWCVSCATRKAEGWGDRQLCERAHSARRSGGQARALDKTVKSQD